MKRLLVAIAAAFICVGCVTGPGSRDSDDLGARDPGSLNLVVDDLMSVLVQLKDPSDITVQYSEPESSLAARIYASLQSQGYAVQKVTEDQGANYLNFEETIGTGSDGETQYKFTIMIGEVAAERSYADRNGQGVTPISPMIIRGSENPVALNPALFMHNENALAPHNYVDYRDARELTGRVPKVTIITQQLVDEIASRPVELPDEVGLNASKLETSNVYFTNESNFSEITRDYRLIRRDIIAFGNDSLRMGPDGKKKVRQIFKSFDQDSDVISMLGCSNGYTALEMGNEGLALGRAKRVLEEFQALGVARTSLLDEGCWAPEALDGRYPGRGVVVELKRRRS